jgi:hypothetical protein
MRTADEKVKRFQQAHYRDAKAAEGVSTTSLHNYLSKNRFYFVVFLTR